MTPIPKDRSQIPRALVGVWRSFWKTPDTSLIQAGANGEVAVAQVRLLVVAILLGLSSQVYFSSGHGLVQQIDFVTSGAAFGIAGVIFIGVKRIPYRAWVGFATSTLDVTLVTSVLVLNLAVGQPHAAINSLLLYSVYFIAIAATTLRFDHRVCALVGLLAAGQYAAIVSYAESTWYLNGSQFAPFQYGMFNAGVQVGRVLLIGVIGVLCTAVIVRVQRLHTLSSTDPLTGLMNRREFEERFEGEMARARRYGRPISVAMIDIDYFKSFNDTYGHAAGDETLLMVAHVLRARLRTGDMVARYGGEEFVVALPETPAQQALATAELLRSAVAATQLRVAGVRDPVGVTISVGVASWPDRGNMITRLVKTADDRLYEAKLGGRDRVVGSVSVGDTTPTMVTA